MNVGVGLIFYDDLESLKRCIPTIDADTIYAVDGRFKRFNSSNPLSTDGSREYLQSFDNVVLIDAPDLNQVEKRNVYFTACKEDFLLEVDSDHWAQGDWKLFRKEIDEKVNDDNGYGYWFLLKDLKRKIDTHWHILGFYKPNKIEYRFRHDWLEVNSDFKIFNHVLLERRERILPYSHNDKYTKLESLKFYNDESLRKKERKFLGNSWRQFSRTNELVRTDEMFLQQGKSLKRRVFNKLNKFRGM